MPLVFSSGTTTMIRIGELAGYRISAVLFPSAGVPSDHFYVGAVERKPAQTELTALAGLPSAANKISGDLTIGSGENQYTFPAIDLVGVRSQITQGHRIRILWFSYSSAVDGLGSASVPGQKEDKAEPEQDPQNAQQSALPNGLLQDQYKFEIETSEGLHGLENLLSFESDQSPSATVVRFSSMANKSNSWLAEILRLHNNRPQGNISDSKIAFSQLHGTMVLNALNIQCLSVDHSAGYMVTSTLPDLYRIARYIKNVAAITSLQQPGQIASHPSYPENFRAIPLDNTVTLSTAIEVATIGFKQGYNSYDTLKTR